MFEYSTLFASPVAAQSQQLVNMNTEQGNVGRSFIGAQTGTKSNLSTTITLNEITDLIQFKEAIMKIDIESHECLALQAADELFDRLVIYDIYMELTVFAQIVFLQKIFPIYFPCQNS